jgi:mannose-6-phosphate isomerase
VDISACPDNLKQIGCPADRKQSQAAATPHLALFKLALFKLALFKLALFKLARHRSIGVISLSHDQAESPPTDDQQAEVYQAQRQEKPWGHEQIFAAEAGKYVGKIIYVTAGASLSLQYHEHKEETISLISGTADVQYGPIGGELTERRFGPGDTIHVPARVVHRVTAVTDTVLAEASTAPDGWREDVVRLQDSYGRAGTTAP